MVDKEVEYINKKKHETPVLECCDGLIAVLLPSHLPKIHFEHPFPELRSLGIVQVL